MINNFRIRTIGLAIVIALVLAGGLLGASSLVTISNLSDIKATWDKFETSRSDKATALGALRRELGYGGMIHQFKNFVLRHDRRLVDLVNAKLGGIASAIAQYRALNLTDPERQALDDIQQTVSAYAHALTVADDMVEAGSPTAEIDRTVRISDTSAIAALATLEKSLSHSLQNLPAQVTKSQSVAGMRRALGFGGLIHNFKNFVLRNEPQYVEQARQDVGNALHEIELYRQRSLTPSERLALDNIASVVNAYSDALSKVETLARQKVRPSLIDQAVRIDDGPALSGFDTLIRAIAFEHEVEALKVDASLSLVNDVSFAVAIGSIAVIVLLILVVLWMTQTLIIRPIQLMTEDMTRLASGDLDFEVQTFGQTSEIGEMARAVEIFRNTAIERDMANKALQETSDRLESSQRIARVGSWDWNIQTGDLEWTDEIYIIFGRDRETFGSTYHNFLECIHQDDRDAVIAAVDAAVHKNIPYDIEHRIVHPDGDIGYVHERGMVYKNEDGEPVRMLGVVHDITERILVEKAKSEFTATVSHELRTPLTSIKGALGLIQAGATGEVPEKFKSMLDIAYRNAERLVLLINDILDMEKIQSGNLQLVLAPINLCPLIDEAIEANKAYGDQYGVIFKKTQCLEHALIMADKNRIMQVFSNLMSNGAKFSPQGGTVELSVTDLGNVYRIAVKDYGSGIPDTFINRVFEKFAQADSSDTRAKGGTGLGLSISKVIVEQHGGSISFVSAVDEGTTFYVDLPKMSA